MFTLPRSAGSRNRKMASNLRCTRQYRRWHWRSESNALCRNTISTNIVLLSTELAAFSGDTLEVLLCWCVGISNLKKETLIANRLTMKLVDDLFADITILEATAYISPCSTKQIWGKLTVRNQHHDCCFGCHGGYGLTERYSP